MSAAIVAGQQQRPQSPPHDDIHQERGRAACEGAWSLDNAEAEDQFMTKADSMRTMQSTVQRIQTTGAQSLCTQGTEVRQETTKASSIMMDVMRLMTRTHSMSTVGSNISLTPATIVRQSKESDKEARGWNRRHSLPGAVVATAFFALVAAVCLGAVFLFFEQHDRMLENEAENVFRRSAEHLLLGKDDPGSLIAIEQGVQELQDELQSLHFATRIKVIVTLIVILGIGTAVVGAVCILVSRKLRLLTNLSKLMEQLSNLDLSTDSEEFSRFCQGKRSSMHEIAQLQDTFYRLIRGIALFARFVPETVVQRIVHGDRRATRLYVDRRCATIMFSDIKDFTSMSEQFAQLNPRDMLLVLTRYFSTMTHIVEAYEGTVGEILGDGLLVFWNTPQNVRNHATKACAAALAQQFALKYLNQHFASMGLPQLEIRIGLHTGQVLTGNIGSLTKMKFGCMGDPVNLASRLEGLCKVYGVGIVCSGSTREKLAPNQGFLCRRLDTVKVKGRDEPTDIYELMGRDETSILPAAVQEAADEPAKRASTSAISQSAGGGMSAGYTRGSNQAPRIQDVVAEAIGGLQILYGRPGSIWEDLSTEDDGAVRVLTSSMGLVSAVAVTAEQQARAIRYEDAFSALQQGHFSMAYQLASELLEEFPDDLAAARLRDVAKEKCTTRQGA
jgi:class 3 adenylate cyclase